ncbi:MAG TPA: beta-ketoacyl-[acyl-carrier-protein] synthase family protein, partial [Tepidisphaeraceae bacterium]|nr:beta-ketoacyl-[acyl-carrier-protein] synthase family protein [Tepidisphaeraceae bacterium]
MNRVVITGIGWITPMGLSIDQVWPRLLAGESGIARTTLFDAATFPTSISAEVKGFDLADHIPDLEKHQNSGRNTRFALAACSQAWKQSGLNRDTLDLDRVGIYLGSGEGPIDVQSYTKTAIASWRPNEKTVDIPIWAGEAHRLMSPVAEIEQEPNMPLAHLAIMTGARGPALNCLTACAASTQAIGEATQILRRGDCDVMIGGGAHSMIHPFGVTGFNRLTALSTANDKPQCASRPFDGARGGFVLGEGAGMVILETLNHAQARGAKILGEIVGYGSTADAFRITDQHPTGEGAVVAMREALADANLTPTDIHYINAHGTGTRENDGNETGAIKQVFGEHAKNVPVSSIKSMMGHLIAAAGAVEFITCVLTIRDQILPPTMNLNQP